MTNIKYEEAAEIRTVTGWVCKTCKRWYGDDEHIARWCCAKDLPCDCGGRVEKGYTLCIGCREKAQHKRWLNLPIKDWDGKSPLNIDDEYFWDEDGLVDYLFDNDLKVEDVEIWLCGPENGHTFSMTNYLEDCLHENSDLDDEEINKTVNDWIKEHGPYSWSRIDARPSLESLKGVIEGLEERNKEAQDEQA